MASTLLLIFICLSCLMFLGMLYGDRLNLLGLTESLWIMPVGEVFGRLWNGLCEAVEESVGFVLAHLSWVVAAASGTAGLVIVIFLMGGGLTADAAALHRDAELPLRSGGVLDVIPEVSNRTQQNTILLTRAELDDSHFVTQAVSRDYVVFGRPEYSPIRPRPRRPIDGGIIDVAKKPPLSGTPRLDVVFQRLGSSTIRGMDIPDVSYRGTLEDSWPDSRFVDRAVQRLLRDNWRESTGLPGDVSDGVGLPGDVVPESPLAAVRDLESRVQFTPGLLVAEHDVRVEKSFPVESATGEITIDVTITNLSANTISGLLVREFLPPDTLVRGAQPEGVLRADTMTWLIEELAASDEYSLRFTVLPATRPARTRDQEFESTTEVSAVTAVTSRTVVEGDSPLPEPFPSDGDRREIPEIAGRPRLRMSINEPADATDVGRWTKLQVTVKNTGTAVAENVVVRVQLAPELDHHALAGRAELDRDVFVNVRRLRAGEVRNFDLEVRPREAGEIQSTAELLMNDAQLDLRTFRIVARDGVEPPPFTDDSTIQ